MADKQSIEQLLDIWTDCPSEALLVRILRRLGVMMLSDERAAAEVAARITEVTGIPVIVTASERTVEYEIGRRFFHQGNHTRH